MLNYAINMHSIADPVPVGVMGASGYTGLEVLRVLSGHDGVSVRFAASDSEAGRPTPVSGLTFVPVADVRADEVDLVFLCLPHGEAARWVERKGGAGARLVDLTADHRPGSGRETGAVYGLPELNPEEVALARLVANPGCYPTGVILSLAPLARRGRIDRARPVVVSAASGVTGAGRSAKRELLFGEVFGDFRAYGLGNGHRHLKEMRALLPGLGLLFVPHLLPVARGILETIAVPVEAGVDAAEVKALWRSVYGGSRAVRVTEEPPTLARVANTDVLELAAFDNPGLEAPTVTVVAALDNLGKGAAGQAVQNMNLMFGYDAGRGLRC